MVEKAKAMTLSQAKESDFGESGKSVSFTDGKGKKVSVSIKHEAIDKDLNFAGCNLIVTSETEMTDRDIYDTYHHLWCIEESSKIMKSDLDARPVYLQKEESINEHFLVCYLAVLLERILQFKVLENKYPASEIYEFIEEFRIVKAEDRYINITVYSDFIKALADKCNLPLTNYFLSETQINSILNYTL